MKVGFLTLVALLWVGAARAESAQALLERYRCYVCHADREARTGPAYVDVAARYKADPQAEARLVAEVRKGTHGSGPWRMPPHPEVSAADARTMLRYILSLQK
ncbi:MAG TPA: c-type cytochrome [Casimicrobiaceae bacterium]